MSKRGMQTPYRDGEAEKARANAILQRELPPRMRQRLVPVPSPGRASVVTILYDGGIRGDGLDYATIDERWEELAEGSSSCAGDGFVIHADEKSSTVYLGGFLPEICKQWNERPGSPSWPREPCVAIDKRTEQVTYFGTEVRFEPRQYDVLLALVELSGDRGNTVADVDILKRVTIAEGADLRYTMSRIRRAFVKVAKELGEELEFAATKLVAEMMPRKRSALGYRIGRPELFSTIA